MKQEFPDFSQTVLGFKQKRVDNRSRVLCDITHNLSRKTFEVGTEMNLEVTLNFDACQSCDAAQKYIHVENVINKLLYYSRVESRWERGCTLHWNPCFSKTIWNGTHQRLHQSTREVGGSQRYIFFKVDMKGDNISYVFSASFQSQKKGNGIWRVKSWVK